jgi:hypothetical protein
MISKLRQKCRVALVQVDIVGGCPSGAEADCLSRHGYRLLALCRKNPSQACARQWISTGKGIFLQLKE